jgi:hypothetical protein
MSDVAIPIARAAMGVSVGGLHRCSGELLERGRAVAVVGFAGNVGNIVMGLMVVGNGGDGIDSGDIVVDSRSDGADAVGAGIIVDRGDIGLGASASVSEP